MRTVKYVVSVSGGLGSFEALRRCLEKHGPENTTGIFADVGRVFENGRNVCGEDDDLFRFLDETEKLLDFPILRLQHPKYKNIWDAFFGERFMGNSRLDTCSKFLKREVIRKWREENAPDATMVIGFSWEEKSRADQYHSFVPNSWFPNCDSPYKTNEDIAEWLEIRGIQRPQLYRDGFTHNNCGGLCVKGGLGQLHDVWRLRPWVYEYAERRENQFRRQINTNATIFRKNGEPITLATLRYLFEQGYVPKTAKGSCGGQCMVPVENEVEA
jgi:hypothetical protein